MLYRATYQRNSTIRKVTFYANDAVEALDFVEFWEHLSKVEVDEITAVGISKYTKTGRCRGQVGA